MRAVKEWIADHDDRAIPRRVRLRVYLKRNGLCPKCGRAMRAGHWACDHIIALANGGEHRESNLQPLCNSPCHSDKTKADVAEKSRSYKRRATNAGARKPRRTIPGRRFDGTPIPARIVFD